MPEVHLLYFAGVRERIGCAGELVEMPTRATPAQILAEVAARHPDARALLEPCRIAVDQDFVVGEFELRAGSEVAVIPPVSGG